MKDSACLRFHSLPKKLGGRTSVARHGESHCDSARSFLQEVAEQSESDTTRISRESERRNLEFPATRENHMKHTQLCKRQVQKKPWSAVVNRGERTSASSWRVWTEAEPWSAMVNSSPARRMQTCDVTDATVTASGAAKMDGNARGAMTTQAEA